MTISPTVMTSPAAKPLITPVGMVAGSASVSVSLEKLPEAVWLNRIAVLSEPARVKVSP